MGKPKRLRSNPKLPPREIKPPNCPSKLCQWIYPCKKQWKLFMRGKCQSIMLLWNQLQTHLLVCLTCVWEHPPNQSSLTSAQQRPSPTPPIQPSSTSATVSLLTPLTPTTVAGSPVTPSRLCVGASAHQTKSIPESTSPPSTVPPGSVLAHYLVYPQAQSSNPSTPTAKASKQVALAQVLTSIENLAILEEKEKKKKELAGEKEQRKKEWEEKKKEREEENTKKAEEKSQKAAEHAKKAAEKATERAQRETGRKWSARSLPWTKNMKTVTNPEINENECCVYSGTYNKDVEEGNGRAELYMWTLAPRWLSDAVDLKEGATICPMHV